MNDDEEYGGVITVNSVLGNTDSKGSEDTAQKEAAGQDVPPGKALYNPLPVPEKKSSENPEERYEFPHDIPADDDFDIATKDNDDFDI
jgi:hypothetical protein